MSPNRMRSRKPLWLVLALVPLLWSCQSMRLAQADRERIRTVHVDPKVAVPDELELGDPDPTLGILGFIATSVEGDRRAKTMAETMASNGIAIGDMVLSQFESALTRTGQFELGEPSTSQAVFHLEVYRLGMRGGVGLALTLKPVIGISASLVDGSGRVVWKRSEATSSLSEQTPAFSYETYLAQPELIRQVFAGVIRLTVSDLVAHLSQAPSS